ncbi:hypothetical protein B0O80DRAFT_428253 [Mortierella sp. GBAus27b]|nr:hypothetical protein B0O80DRAFT_428253 [Mortierella sp. GBAus27b]
MCILVIVAAIRLGVIAIIVCHIRLAIQFFKVKQIVSETTPDLAMGWLPTATIVLGSMILPIYVYSVILGLSERSFRIQAPPHVVMALLGIFNFVATILNPREIYRVIGHKDDEDITECIYPTLCPFTTGSVMLGFFVMAGVTSIDIIGYGLLNIFG